MHSDILPVVFSALDNLNEISRDVGFFRKKVKKEDVETIDFVIAKLIQFHVRKCNVVDFDKWYELFERLLNVHHRTSFRCRVFALMVEFMERLLFPPAPSTLSEKSQAELLCLLDGIGRKEVFAFLRAFQNESHGESFLDACAKSLDIPGQAIVNIQHSQCSPGSPKRGFISLKSADMILLEYPRLKPFLVLLLSSCLVSPVLSSDDAKESRFDHNVLLFLVSTEDHKKSDCDKILRILYTHVLACEDIDALQIWYLFIYNHIYTRLYPNLVENNSEYFHRVSAELFETTKKWNMVIPEFTAHHGFQAVTVGFIVSGLHREPMVSIALCAIPRTHVLVKIFGYFLETVAGHIDLKAEILHLYRSWVTLDVCPLTTIAKDNALSLHLDAIVDQCCSAIEGVLTNIQPDSRKVNIEVDPCFLVAVDVLRALSQTEHILTKPFATATQRILKTAIKVSELTRGANVSDTWRQLYVQPTVRLYFEILILSKRLDEGTWGTIYRQVPGLLTNPVAIHAWGDTMVILTRHMLMGIYHVSEKMKMQDQIISKRREEQNKKNAAKSSTTRPNYVHKRQGLSTTFVTAFDLNSLKQLDYLVEPVTTEYPNQKSLSFLDALKRAYPEDESFEKHHDERGVPHVDGLLLSFRRLLRVISCGRGCTIWKSNKHASAFACIVTELVRVLRAWIKMFVRAELDAPLLSTIHTVFVPWLLSCCDTCHAQTKVFDSGCAISFSALCTVMSLKTEEILLENHLTRAYICIGRALMQGRGFGNHPVLAGIITHSVDLFASQHRGISVLIPMYLCGIDRLTANLSREAYNSLGVPLRKSIVSILVSCFSYSVVHQTMPSTLLVHTMDLWEINRECAVPTFKPRLMQSLSLLLRICTLEYSAVKQFTLASLATVFHHRHLLVKSKPEQRMLDCADGLQLIDVFLDDGLRSQLRNFCAKEYCTENIDFWVAVEEFRATSRRCSGDIVTRPLGQNIYATFVQPGAHREVNLPSHIAQTIHAAAKEGSFFVEFFDEAQEEIFRLLDHDKFPRFKTLLDNFEETFEETIIASILNCIETPTAADSVVVVAALQSLAFISTESSSHASSSRVLTIEKICDSLKSINQRLSGTEKSNAAAYVAIMKALVECLADWVTLATVPDLPDHLVEQVLCVLLDAANIEVTPYLNDAENNKSRHGSKKITSKGGEKEASRPNTLAISRIRHEAMAALSRVFRFFNAPEDCVSTNGYRTVDIEREDELENAIFFAFRKKLFSLVRKTECTRVTLRDAFGCYSWNFMPLSKDDRIANSSQKKSQDLSNYLSVNYSTDSGEKQNGISTVQNRTNPLDRLLQLPTRGSGVDEVLDETDDYVLKTRESSDKWANILTETLIDEASARTESAQNYFPPALPGLYSQPVDSDCDLCRLLLVHLGLVRLEEAHDLIPLEANFKFQTFLRSLDRAPVRHCHRVGFIYVAPHQTKEAEIISNLRADCSSGCKNFLLSGGLGKIVYDLHEHKKEGKFCGGLDTREPVGPGKIAQALYFETTKSEVLFHVLPWLPFKAGDKQQIDRKRHLGNDAVVISYSDSNVAMGNYGYDVRAFISGVTEVHIVLLPCGQSLLKIEIYARDKNLHFGPLIDGMLVHVNVAPELVRETAINASCAVNESRFGKATSPITRRVDLLNDVYEKFRKEDEGLIERIMRVADD